MIENILEKRLAYYNSFKDALDKEEVGKDFESKASKLIKQFELNYLYSELLVLIPILIEANVKLSDEVLDFYNGAKQSTYKRKFYLEDGEIKDAVKGFVEEEIERLKSNPAIDQIRKTLESM